METQLGSDSVVRVEKVEGGWREGGRENGIKEEKKRRVCSV